MAGELVRPTPAVQQIHDFSTFKFDFLAILLLLFDETIFSETTGSDLSNGVGLVSVYVLLKTL